MYDLSYSLINLDEMNIVEQASYSLINLDESWYFKI